MKKELTIFIVLLSVVAANAQPSTPPNPTPNPPPTPPALPPSRPNAGGQPFQYNTNRSLQADPNGFLPNRYTAALSNDPGTNANRAEPLPGVLVPGEAVATTNGDLAVNFTITNTLASMAPAQARNVIQLQTSLNGLQSLAVNLGPGQTLQVIQQNPQLQTQVQQLSTRIVGLALGPKPSMDIAQRLSTDLVRVSARARLTPDGQLVLAVIINQISNCGALTRAQVDDTINNAAVVLQSGGAPLALVHPVTCDLHSIVYELQPNLGM
jgi:hypothetical protein